MKLSTFNSSLSVIPIILLFLLILILLYAKYLNDQKEFVESFLNRNDKVDDKYLYPTRDLEAECAKNGLQPAFMPQVCDIDGKLDVYSNCKCADLKGRCKLCYPKIKRDITNAEPIYEVNKHQDEVVQNVATRRNLIHDNREERLKERESSIHDISSAYVFNRDQLIVNKNNVNIDVKHS
jgi:hypothetical protein